MTAWYELSGSSSNLINQEWHLHGDLYPWVRATSSLSMRVLGKLVSNELEDALGTSEAPMGKTTGKKASSHPLEFELFLQYHHCNDNPVGNYQSTNGTVKKKLEDRKRRKTKWNLE